MEYTLDHDESDYQVDVYFDGAATQWPGTLESNPENPVNKYYEEVRERRFVGGACGFCVNAYGTYEELADTDIDLLGGREDHGPHAGRLIDDGYELITV